MDAMNLINSDELAITFDVSGVDEHLPSLAFDISVILRTSFQKAQVDTKEVWFSCSSYDQFTADLDLLLGGQQTMCMLKDLSENPVLICTKNGERYALEITAQNTVSATSINLKTVVDYAEIFTMFERLKAFEQWW